MKPKNILFLLVLALAAVFLSGCTGSAGMTNSWPGLATDGETAYLASGSFVYAINLNDGKEIWRYPAKAENNLQFIAQPVIASDGTVIIGSAGNDLRALFIQPVDHLRDASALLFVGPVEIAILVQQHQTFLGLALTGEEHALNLRKTQHAIISMHGF